MTLTRRALVAATALAPFAARAAGSRVVALDWALAATAVALGAPPVGVAEKRLYRDWVRAPALPPDAAEVGLRTDPSLETLQALRPDLILTNALHAGVLARLQTIAPTFANATFGPSRTPLENAKAATRELGALVSRRAEAEALIGDAQGRIAAVRLRLRPVAGAALLPLSAIDGRRLIAYGEGSLFVDALRAVGLAGVWAGPTSFWGSRTIAVADLADAPPGDLLLVDPMPGAAAGMLDPAGLLARLCALQGRKIRRLPPAWAFGDLTAAARFAGLVADALK